MLSGRIRTPQRKHCMGTTWLYMYIHTHLYILGSCAVSGSKCKSPCLWKTEPAWPRTQPAGAFLLWLLCLLHLIQYLIYYLINNVINGLPIELPIGSCWLAIAAGSCPDPFGFCLPRFAVILFGLVWFDLTCGWGWGAPYTISHAIPDDIWHPMVPHGTSWYPMVHHGTSWCPTVLHGAPWYPLHSIVHSAP